MVLVGDRAQLAIKSNGRVKLSLVTANYLLSAV